MSGETRGQDAARCSTIGECRKKLAAEHKEIRALIGSPNRVEAVTARFEKRDPTFAEA